MIHGQLSNNIHQSNNPLLPSINNSGFIQHSMDLNRILMPNLLDYGRLQAMKSKFILVY